ncbi:LAS seventeen-binding protein 3 [Fusarium oxysporum f. sp. albedinis]|nr:LAS seventeen-binding protein 3 [Fusarium oxysporum f. sp. albedinis]
MVERCLTEVYVFVQEETVAGPLLFLVLKPHSIGLTIVMQVSVECNVKGFPTPKEQMIYGTGPGTRTLDICLFPMENNRTPTIYQLQSHT